MLSIFSCACWPSVCLLWRNEIVLSHKKERHDAIYSTLMQLEMITLSEGSQKKKDEPHVTSLTRGTWTLTPMSPPMKQKRTHGCGEQTGGCRVGESWVQDGAGGRPGLADVRFHMRDGQITRPCCATQRTIVNILWWTITERIWKKFLTV